MAKTLLFIVNPRAGRTRSSAPLFDVVVHFSQAGYLVAVRQTGARGDATRFAREEGGNFDLVACFGGDGTLNEVVAGLMARTITSSAGRQLDVGSFNGRPFVYVASFGAFTRASYSAPQSVKNDLGHLAYILEGVKDISTLRPYRATITADGEVLEGSFLFGAITNATSVGGLVKLQEDKVVLDDGRFELLLVPNPRSAQDLQALLRGLVLQDYTGGGFIFRHATDITVETPESFPWALDGEYGPGEARVEIQNLRRRLTFML